MKSILRRSAPGRKNAMGLPLTAEQLLERMIELTLYAEEKLKAG